MSSDKDLKYLEVKAFLASIVSELEEQRDAVLLQFGENQREARDLSNMCTGLMREAGEEFEGKDLSEHTLENVLRVQMLMIGGATIQKWLAEKSVEYEDLSDLESL